MHPIAKYLQRTKQTQSSFASMIGVTQSAVYQYINEIRPVPEKVCVRIEQATEGRLTRKKIRKDWADIWPELKEVGHA